MTIDSPTGSADTAEPAGRSDGPVTAADVDRLEEEFVILFEAYRLRARDYAARIDPRLQPSGFRTLSVLIHQGSCGAKSLADTLGYDKSVLSRQLHQLEELGLVERAHDPNDGRAVVLTATPAAVAKVEALRATERGDFRMRLMAWDPTDLRELVRLLGALRAMRD
jgi:DNA-binding MarR family transcriptional regulator